MEQTKTKIDLTSSKVKNIVIILSIFATVKMLFFAFGLDEEYQLVMSYRNAMGDKLFYSMWEPHQSSAFLCSIFSFFVYPVNGSSRWRRTGSRKSGVQN